MSKTKENLELEKEHEIDSLNADLAWEHTQHKKYEPNCSECYGLDKFWSELTPEDEETVQDFFNQKREFGGIPITKHTCESLFEIWSDGLSLEEIKTILNPCEYEHKWVDGKCSRCEVVGEPDDFSGATDSPDGR
jgi:hypothetical protein